MKKHIVLFSSLLLVGTAMTVGAINADAATKTKTSSSKVTRAEVDFFEGGVGYKTDASLGNNELMVYSHYFNILPENVVIPEKIKDPKTGTEYTVVSIGASSLSRSTEEDDIVKSITLPKTIKKIGNSAFYSRTNLETITINEGVTSIGKSAFSGNSSLKTIKLPSTLTDLGDQAFLGCSSLESITIPNGVTKIGMYTFSKNTSLKTITLPSTLTSIGAYAFNDCSALESVKIPSGVTELPQHLFKNCTSLVSVDIPDSVTTLSSTIFDGANSLQTVKLSKNLTVIPNSLFKDLTALKEISIPDNVTTIEDQAFRGAVSLTTVRLPANLKTIPNSAFQDTKALTKIEIPDSVTSIESHAFKGSGLKAVRLPSGITKRADLGGNAFETNTIEKIIFTSEITGGIQENQYPVFSQPEKVGYIFEGWLKDGVATTEGLSKIAEKGNATVTAKWKEDGSVPSSDTSDATITLLAKQETGAISFGNVTTDAKIAFKDVTLKGTEAATTEEDTAKTNAKIVVNDTRSDKSKGWNVQAKYQDTNFSDKGMKLSLKPTAASGSVSNVDLSTTASTVFKKGTGQADKYDIKLNPTLAIPTNFTVSSDAETTKINWVLTPEE